MFLIKDGKKVWDKSKVYGYPDEIIVNGEPEDNTIPIEGCDEVLTHDEIDRLFPNQHVLLEVVEEVEGYWTKAKVLYIHGDDTGFLKQFEENNWPENYLEWPTFSQEMAIHLGML